MSADSVLRTAAGRIRLGWRLLLFVGIATAVTFAVALVAPATMVGGFTSVLVGSVVAGGAVLALDGRGPGALGFHLAPSVPRELASGTGLGVLLAVAVVALATMAGGIRWSLEAGSGFAWIAAGMNAAGVLLLPAAAEEALLRGYPLQSLTEAWWPAWALLLTSALFGLMHLPNPGVTALAAANVGAAGLFLGVLYLRTGSLWWATGAHLGWNWGLGFLADTPVSGLEVAEAPFVSATLVGPDWLGGGPFGLEGSVVATVGFFGAAAAVWFGRWPRLEAAALARRPLAVVVGKGSVVSGASVGLPTNE